MAVTTDQVKELRDQTGISVMQCKKALEEAGGDIQKALVLLRKQAGAIAQRKADRMLGAGTVQAYVHTTREVGAMVLLACETDFVAKNDEFIKLAYEIAMHVAATDPQFVNREEIGEEERKIASEVFLKEVGDKPAALQEKILEGKLTAYFKESILLEQSYIKDPEKIVQDLIKEATQKFGERIEITKMIRISVK
ncbi:MAG TPA: elongation factor Ts [Candidatus Paceibacterota bacterium]|jgi:elongation factor Ts